MAPAAAPTEDGSWRQGLNDALLGAGDVFDTSKNGAAEPLGKTPPNQPSTAQLAGSIWAIVTSFFRNPSTRFKALALSGTLLVTMFFLSSIQLWNLKQYRDFQNALHDKDKDKFVHTLWLIVGVAIAKMPVVAFREALGGSLGVEWRRYLTNALMDRYIGVKQAYYRLKMQACEIDNPDQRIAQDTANFTGTVIDFTRVMVQSVITLATQAGMLISISPELFAFVVAWSLLNNFVSFVVFGKKLTKVNRRVLAQEASLRFSLVRVRENAEPIAFYQGAAFERARCGVFFSDLLRSQYQKLFLAVSYHSFQDFVGTLMFVLPYAIVAGKYFSGELDFGALTVASSVLGQLEGALNTLVYRMEQVTAMGAQAMRIQQIWDQLESISGSGLPHQLPPPTETRQASGWSQDTPMVSLPELGADGIRVSDLWAAGGPPGGESADGAEYVLHLEELTLQPPCGGHVPLVSSLSLSLHAGERLLVCGPSGVGKSSVLRAIGGLWASGHGRIRRPPAAECFFVPQDPYLCLGSLRDNATYPGAVDASGNMLVSSATDEEVASALSRVGLHALLERFSLDETVDLDSTLSGGERQRLGFARVLLRPGNLRFAILDEATSALDQENETNIYQLLHGRVPSNVSVGHRANLVRFHSHRLLLDRGATGECTWQLSRLEDCGGGGAANWSSPDATGFSPL